MPSKDVMHKFKRGTLHSGSKRGPKVKKRSQAIAIKMSEQDAERHGRGHYGKRKKRSRSSGRRRYNRGR